MSNPTTDDTDQTNTALVQRQKILRELEDIQNSLKAASQKVAHLQLETEASQPELQDGLDTAMNGIGSGLDAVTSMTNTFEIETNRMQNEGEL